jgi:nitrogenase molybdenum-cofactor synthesis protein NifE
MLVDNKADIMLSGGRTQFIALKAKMPWLDINQERIFPYAGYDGMVELVKRIALSIHNPVWQQVRESAPWDANGHLVARSAATGSEPEAKSGIKPTPVEEYDDHFLAHHRKKFVGADASDAPEC